MTRYEPALQRLEARGGWDEADLNDFAILEQRLARLEKLLREIRVALTSAGFDPEFIHAPVELTGLAAVIDAEIGPTPRRPSEHPALAAEPEERAG